MIFAGDSACRKYIMFSEHSAIMKQVLILRGFYAEDYLLMTQHAENNIFTIH
jgi:hypothetical protein